MAKADKATVAVLAQSPSHLLHRALQLALDVYAEETGAGAVTQRQYAVLAAVAADEGLTQTDLVTATGIDRSTLADMIARMIDKGVLARERSATDARAKTVRLTAKGRAALDEVGPKVAARMARFDRARRDVARRAGEGALALADVAATHGYADQAHLAREFRSLAGCSPSQWVEEEVRTGMSGGADDPDAGLGPEVGSVQDRRPGRPPSSAA